MEIDRDQPPSGSPKPPLPWRWTVALRREIGLDSHREAAFEHGGVTVCARATPGHHSDQRLVVSVAFIGTGILVLVDAGEFASNEDEHPLRDHLADDRLADLTVTNDPIGENHPHKRILPGRSGEDLDTRFLRRDRRGWLRWVLGALRGIHSRPKKPGSVRKRR